jgi:hemolysin D
VLVENGEHVRKGQVLVTFDSADADADVNQLAADLSSVEAEAARRQAALVSIGDRIIKPIAPIRSKRRRLPLLADRSWRAKPPLKCFPAASRTFSTENLEKLADAERRIDEDTQRLAKVRARQSRMVLSSPIEGTVSSLSITTPGQVIAAGEEVMRIVPDGIGIEIEAYIPNRDIGFVKPGQDAVVKIESLPFTRYGTIDAKLSRVAGDAIPQPDAERTESNPIQATRQAAFAGAERTQNLVFPAIFQPTSTVVMADGAMVPLSAGMAVTVEIKTGNRRILEYLFSPLLEVANEAMKER